MRKFAIVLSVLLVVVLAGAWAVPRLVDVNRHHDRIQAEVEKRLGRKVSLGPLHLSLIPLAIRVQGATVAEAPGFGEGETFARTDTLYVRADLLPLLRGEVRLRALELEKPQIEIVRDASGAWNFSSLGKTAAEPQSPQKTQELALDLLRIQDGQVAITDLQKKQPRVVYDHIDLTVRDYRPGQPFRVDLAAHLPGEGKQLARFSAKVGPIHQDDALRSPLDGSVKLEEVSIAAVQRFLSTPVADTDGLVSGDATVTGREGTLQSKGSLRIDGAKLRGVAIGYPIAADYEAENDLNTDRLRVSKGALKLGSMVMSVTGTVNAASTPAEIDLHVTTREASISEIARLSAALGFAGNPRTKIDGRLKADIHARGAATKPALTGSLSAQSLAVSGPALTRPVGLSGVQLTMWPDAVRSNNFTATTAGTTVTMKVALTQYTSTNPQVEADVRASGAQVEGLLDIARAYGVKAVEGITGSGALSLDLHASGPLENASAMTASGTGALKDARIQTPSLRVPLLVGGADIRFTQNTATLQNLRASLGSMNASGVLTVRDFAEPKMEFRLAADKLNLNEMPSWFEAARPGTAAAPAEASTLGKVAGRGTMTIGTVVYDEVVLSSVKSDAALEHGVLRLAPLTADVYGGAQTGSIVIDMNRTPAQYAVNTRMERVDANKLVSSTTSLKQILHGLLMANANTTFRAGATSDQMARSLSGDVTLDLRDGKINNMDLGYEIASLGRFLEAGQVMKRFTSVASLTGHFDVQNGVARTNDLKLAIHGIDLAATGTANLVDLKLDMRVVALLSRKYSDEVGGTRVGGYMTTALADENGQLVIPLLLSGTFTSPRVAPDVKQIAELKVKQTISKRLGSVGGLLGRLTGDRNKEPAAQRDEDPQGEPQAQPTDEPRDLLKQLLGAASRRKQRNEPTPSPAP